MNVATMQRAATMAPSRSAGALRRSNNALRSGAAARVRPQPCRQRVVTQAAMLPTAVRAIADMTGAFVLVFCGLNWASLRRVRKEVEKVEQDRAGKESDRNARIKKLTGQGQHDDKAE